MGMRGNFAGLKKLQREFAGLARKQGAEQTAMARAVTQKLRPLIKEQFAKGVGPDGAPQERTKRGKPGLVSRKLGSGIRFAPIPGGLRISAPTQHLDDILGAHQNGHVYSARQSQGGFQFRGKTGKLISRSKFLRAVRDAQATHSRGSWRYSKQVGKKTRFVGERAKIAPHRVGARVLPPRHIVPAKGEPMPPRWVSAIQAGLREFLRAWAVHAGAT